MNNSKITKWSDRIILGGLILLVFIIPFVFHTATLVSIGLLLPFIAWIIKLILNKGKIFVRTPLLLPLLLWGLIILISSSQSVNPQYSFNEFRGEYLKQALLFLLVTNSMNENHKLKYLIYALLLGCFFVSSFTVFGYYTKIALDKGQATGTYGSITRQAMYFLFLIPFTFSIFLYSNKKVLKYISLFLFLISSWALALTLIRGVWVICAVSILILAFRKNWKTGLIALLFLTVAFTVSPRVRGRILSSFDFSQASNRTLSGRTILIKNSLPIIKDHLWVGAGYGPDIFNYLATDYNVTDIPNLSPPIPSEKQQPDAHNLYIQLIIETGIIGLIIFSYLLFTFYRSTLKSFHKIEKNRDLLFTIILIISGVLIYGLVGYFYEDRNGLLFWLFVSLAVSIISNDGKEEIFS